MKILKLFFFIGLLASTNSVLAQSFNGKTQWLKTLEISSYISSSIHSIHVVNGQKVIKGERLLSMDQSELVIDYDIAQAQLLARKPAKEKAEMDYDRALELYDRTLITDVALKTAEFDFTAAKARYSEALAILAKAKFYLDQSVITSPINGRVLRVNTSVGFYSDREIASSLITLVDDAKMHAVAHLKVSQWTQSLIGKKALVIINKKQHEGVVLSLSLLPVDKPNGLSVYPVVVEFETHNLLPEGMPLTIEIE